MGATTIEWTEKTWNPTRGCSRVSAGCVNCYAERQAARFAGFAVPVYSGREPKDKDPSAPFRGFVHIVNGHPAWTGKVELIESKLMEPLHWKKPARIFVNSMSDLFHEALPDEAIDRVFAVMALCPQHSFQVLTKRPKRMLEYFSARRVAEIYLNGWKVVLSFGPSLVGHTTVMLKTGADGNSFPLPNVWLGVSVEDQKTADERIPLLLQTPAAVRFVSYEPALGPVDFANIRHHFPGGSESYEIASVLEGSDGFGLSRKRARLDQVIIGGESGPGARPFNIEWARNTIRQCRDAGVAAFFKQAGSNAWDGTTRVKLHDRKGGNLAELPVDLRVREFPEVPC